MREPICTTKIEARTHTGSPDTHRSTGFVERTAAGNAAMEGEDFGTPVVHVNADGWGPDSR